MQSKALFMKFSPFLEPSNNNDDYDNDADAPKKKERKKKTTDKRKNANIAKNIQQNFRHLNAFQTFKYIFIKLLRKELNKHFYGFIFKAIFFHFDIFVFFFLTHLTSKSKSVHITLRINWT